MLKPTINIIGAQIEIHKMPYFISPKQAFYSKAFQIVCVE